MSKEVSKKENCECSCCCCSWDGKKISMFLRQVADFLEKK